MEQEKSIGGRVEDNEGFKGTIRYIGPVATSKNLQEIWMGVEWDVPTRGKHDGSCVDSNNVVHRYFQCSQGSGSFVKSTKVVLGRPLTEALRERYVSIDAPEVAPDGIVPDAYVVTSKGAQKKIEFVGEKKIRIRQQLSEVNKITIRNDQISSSGDDLASLMSHVVELDLQDNLLSKWIEVFKIGLALPMLETFLLHGNKIRDLDTVDEAYRNSLQCIKVLALNFCGITNWSTVDLLERHLPNIAELYIAGNQLSNIVHLDVGACHIPSWAVVADSFGKLEKLEELILDANPISEVYLNRVGDFATLRRISLGSTLIGSFNDINQLNSYPSLIVLRLTNIPLFSNLRASEVRPEVIARVAKLEIYNASVISVRERLDAEKNYLRNIIRVMQVESQQESSSESANLDDVATKKENFLQYHPRYTELNAKYGSELIPLGSSTSSGHTMASEMVTITFHNLSFSSNGSLEPVQRRLPSSLSVDKIKLMVKQLFGLDPHIQQLSLRPFKDSIPIVMDESDASIKYFGATENSDIFINEAKAT